MASIAGRGWIGKRLGEDGHSRPGREKRKKAAMVWPQEMGGQWLKRQLRDE